ncbi:IS701 family transposase [Streptomyces sp. cg2]|uniref:IS701 family transposase n=1 Tax=Streptomyces sp. cg2 TaxID=3238799 RepID=UPI0034E2E925
MDLGEVEQLREDFGEFIAEVFSLLKRRDQRGWVDCYLRGLTLDGRRKSVEPMAERLPDGNMQAMQQFVSQSTWDHTPVLQAVASRLCEVIAPQTWVIDDASFLKAGDQSVGAARQWCGALDKKSLCQVGVSLHAVTDAVSVLLSWRLFLPEEWADPGDERRAKAGVPEGMGHRERWRLALDVVNEALGWGLAGRVVVVDARVRSDACLPGRAG